MMLGQGPMRAQGQQIGCTQSVVFKTEMKPASGQSMVGGLDSRIINHWRQLFFLAPLTIHYNVIVIGRVTEKGFFSHFPIPEMLRYINYSTFRVPETTCDVVDSTED